MLNLAVRQPELGTRPGDADSVSGWETTLPKG